MFLCVMFLQGLIYNILMDISRNKNLILFHCNEFLNNDPSDTIPTARAQLEHSVELNTVLFCLEKVLHPAIEEFSLTFRCKSMAAPMHPFPSC
jgi:hypothetical protein